MAVRSRRKAREAALRVLYEVELGHIDVADALEVTLEEAQLTDDLAKFATSIVDGVIAELAELDHRLSGLIKEYAYDRVAAVDRNIMRVAAYELLYMPAVPPAVTLNEAIEIAKRYSTAESGKFVNGVLGKLLLDTPKADWNPADAPQDVEEQGEPSAPLEVEEIEVDEVEAKKLLRVGGWTLRSEEVP